MNCMKCGREIEADQVFCEDCRSEMEKYPVKPNTLVQIPNRPAVHHAKKVHQRRATAEEQIAVLKKKCRRLRVALVLSVLMALGLAAVVGVTVYELDVQRFLGQNYSTVETTSSGYGSFR